MLMPDTTKLTEYIVEPFGRLAEAMVCEMFCNFRRSTVAEPPVGVSEMFSEFTGALVVELLVVVFTVVVLVLPLEVEVELVL